MKKRVTKCLAYVMSVALLLGLLPMVDCSQLGLVRKAKADAISVTGGDSMTGATTVSTETEYMDSISEAGEEDWYQITSPDYDSYVKVTIKNINISYFWNDFTMKLYTGLKEPKLSVSAASGSTNAGYVKLQKNTTYYMKFYHPDANKTGDYTFSIEFNKDEDGNSIDTASGIHLDTKYVKDLAAPGDEDWYKLQITNTQKYIINIKNNNMSYYSGDFYVKVYTSNQEKLFNLSAGNGESNSDTVTLEAGNTYYLIFDHPGDVYGYYSFSICTSSDIELSSTTQSDSVHYYQEDAVKITGGATQESATTVVTEGKNYMDSISETGEEDWYQFTTPNYDSYVKVTIKNINISYFWNDFTMKLYTGLKEPKLSVSAASGSTNAGYVKLQKNTTYYMKFYHPDANKTGDYTFSVYFCLDEDGDEKKEATTMSLNTEYERYLSAYTDEDWFIIEPSVTQNYILYAKNNNLAYYSGDFTVTLYAENEETLATLSVGSGSEDTTKVSLTSGNKYYICCKHPSGAVLGNYSFYLADSADADITTLHALIKEITEEVELNNDNSSNTSVPTVSPTESVVTAEPAIAPTLEPEPTAPPTEEPAEPTLEPEPTAAPTETPQETEAPLTVNTTYFFSDDQGIYYSVVQEKTNGVIEGYSDVTITAVAPEKFAGTYPSTVTISESIDPEQPTVAVERISCYNNYYDVTLPMVVISDGITRIDQIASYAAAYTVMIPDSVTAISSVDAFGVEAEDLTILCNPGSYAESFANENGLKMEYISEYSGTGDDIEDETPTPVETNSPIILPGDTTPSATPNPSASASPSPSASSVPSSSSAPTSKLYFQGEVKEVAAGMTVLNEAILQSNGTTVKNATIIYTSSNTSIATVSDSGLVTGILPGNVTITAQYGSLTASYQLTVTQGTFSNVRVTKRGKTLKVTAVKGAKVTVKASRWYMGKSKKTVKANAKGIAKIKFKRRIKGTVTITIKKAGFQTRTIKKRYR